MKENGKLYSLEILSLVSPSSSLFTPRITMSVISLQSSLAEIEHPRANLVFRSVPPFCTLLALSLCAVLCLFSWVISTAQCQVLSRYCARRIVSKLPNTELDRSR